MAGGSSASPEACRGHVTLGLLGCCLLLTRSGIEFQRTALNLKLPNTWAPSVKPRRGRLPDNFRAEALRQAKEAQRLRVKLNGMGERIAWYVTWLSGGGIWNVLRDACGQGRFGALAAKVDS